MNHQYYIFLVAFLLYTLPKTWAQKWPIEMQLFDDAHWLNIGKVLPTDFYKHD